MPRISRKASVALSLTFAVLFMLIILFGAYIMPQFAERLIEIKSAAGSRVTVGSGARFFILLLSYLVLADCAVIDVLIFLLLRRVKKSLIFTDLSVALIRYISWGAICFGALFALLGIWFRLSLAIAFAGFFLGLTIRVVKNVIEEATEIKGENDLTV